MFATKADREALDEALRGVAEAWDEVIAESTRAGTVWSARRALARQSALATDALDFAIQQLTELPRGEGGRSCFVPFSDPQFPELLAGFATLELEKLAFWAEVRQDR